MQRFRLLIVALVLILLCIAFSACGNSTPQCWVPEPYYVQRHYVDQSYWMSFGGYSDSNGNYIDMGGMWVDDGYWVSGHWEDGYYADCPATTTTTTTQKPG